MATPRMALMAWAMTLPFAGCVSVAGLQDWQYCQANKTRARNAWFDTHTNQQRTALGRDYEDGFKTGFYDRATGKDCQLPAVPPQRYWAAKFQSCEGQACIDTWFRGYEGGMLAAEVAGYPSFNRVPTSATAPVLNRTACGTCYSPDRCDCEPQVFPVQMLAPSTVPNVATATQDASSPSDNDRAPRLSSPDPVQNVQEELARPNLPHLPVPQSPLSQSPLSQSRPPQLPLESPSSVEEVVPSDVEIRGRRGLLGSDPF